eukprot:15354020-Ditylum_brightwellii.AAC.1
MKHLEEAMKISFRIQYGNIRDQGIEENKISLAAFQGVCYRCKETGHKASNCPKKKNHGSKSQLRKKANLVGKGKKKSLTTNDESGNARNEYLLVAHDNGEWEVEHKDRVIVEDERRVTCFHCSGNDHKWADCRAMLWGNDESSNCSKSSWDKDDDSSTDGSDSSWVKEGDLKKENSVED